MPRIFPRKQMYREYIKEGRVDGRSCSLESFNMKFTSVCCLFLLLVSASFTRGDEEEEPYDSSDVEEILSTLTTYITDPDDQEPVATTLPPTEGEGGEPSAGHSCGEGSSELVLEEGVESLQEKVHLSVVDNYLDFKNETDPAHLKRVEVDGLLGLFSKDTYWRVSEESSLVFPVLIKVSVKPDFCQNPTLKHIELDSSEDAETSLKINNQWHSFDDDVAFPVAGDQTGFFEIYLSLPSGSEGGIKDLKVVFCCSNL